MIRGRRQRRRRRRRAADDGADQWKQSFLRAPYLRDEIVRMGYVCETFETCTTWANFPALDAAVRAAAQRAMEEHCGGGLVTCRFTHLYPDGPAPYYTIIAPSRPGRQLAQWDAIKDAVSRALIGHGGTITHHHAVGKDHRPYYLAQNSPLSLAMLAAAKRAVDPQGIMNPGTLLPPDQRPSSPGVVLAQHREHFRPAEFGRHVGALGQPLAQLGAGHLQPVRVADAGRCGRTPCRRTCSTRTSSRS